MQLHLPSRTFPLGSAPPVYKCLLLPKTIFSSSQFLYPHQLSHHYHTFFARQHHSLLQTIIHLKPTTATTMLVTRILILSTLTILATTQTITITPTTTISQTITTIDTATSPPLLPLDSIIEYIESQWSLFTKGPDEPSAIVTPMTFLATTQTTTTTDTATSTPVPFGPIDDLLPESIGELFGSIGEFLESEFTKGAAEPSTTVTPRIALPKRETLFTDRPSSSPMNAGLIIESFADFLASVVDDSLSLSMVNEADAEASATDTPTTTLPKREALETLKPVKSLPFTPTITPAIYPRALPHAVQAHVTSLKAQPMWTAMPESVLGQLESDPYEYLLSLLSAGKEPTRVSAVPTTLDYLVSVGQAQLSPWKEAAWSGPMTTSMDVVQFSVKGPAPTHGPRVKVVGAALAVGAAGLAVL